MNPMSIQTTLLPFSGGDFLGAFPNVRKLSEEPGDHFMLGSGR
jgi:hypothetical protein